MYCQGHLQSTLCRWLGDLFSRTLSGHHRDIYSRQWMPYRNGRQRMASGLQPTSAKSYISLHHGVGFRDPPIVRIGNTRLPVEESKIFLELWWDSHLSFKKHISVLKTQCKEALNLIRVVVHLKWGGDRDTLLILYRAIVRSKFDYGCIVYGTASNTNLRQLDSIHNSGLRLALGAFCTSPVSSLCTEANEAPLEERRLKLSMHYYVKTRACIDNPAHHALHEFDRTTRGLHAPRPNGRGGMTRPPAPPIGFKVEEAMTSAEINAELVCPLMTPNFPPGTHDYDPKRHDLIEGVSKCIISGQ